MNVYNLLRYTLLSLLFLAASCNDILEEEPRGLLSSQTFWNNANNAIGAIDAVYSTPQETPNGEHNWNFWIESAGNDFTHIDRNHPFGMATGTWDAGTRPFWDLWKNSYRPISRANFVISNVGTADIPEALAQRIEGEGRFLRAMHYFNLVRAFGDVPLVLEQTQATDEFLVSRTPAQEVYDAIIQDLAIATDGRLPLRSGYGEEGIGRATLGAAQALLAKVHLTLGNYQQTVDLTREVIASGEYALEPEFTDVFKAENDTGQEWVFSYPFSGESPNTTHTTASFTFPNNLGAYGFRRGFGNLNLTLDLVDLYTPDDQRFSDMVWNEYIAPDSTVVKFNKGTGYFSKKYYDTDFSKDLFFTRVNYPIIRYSDVLLMYAEALNEVSPLDGEAFATLNQVKVRAGLTEVTPAEISSPEAFLEEVLNERRKEFVNENQRLWDLKRRGLFLQYVRQQPDAQHKEYMDLFPIPQNEIDANPNLEQNPGY